MTTQLTAIQLGELARKALVEGVEGKVMGITSRGVFLNAGERILFITDANYRSPYNIQIAIKPRQFDPFTPGDDWTFTQHELLFRSRETSIDINQASLWRPSSAPKIVVALDQQIHRMQVLFTRMSALDPNKGWLYLTDLSEPMVGSEAAIIHELTERFLIGVAKSDLASALQAGKSILGRGGGLTPSGDDWISGFLLYHSRTGNVSPFIRELGQALTALAFESTTKISANRIEAACEGWSEELFLEVVDSLLVNDAEIEDFKIERLVNFGHSSGVDTCVGIGAAVRTI